MKGMLWVQYLSTAPVMYCQLPQTSFNSSFSLLKIALAMKVYGQFRQGSAFYSLKCPVLWLIQKQTFITSFTLVQYAFAVILSFNFWVNYNLTLFDIKINVLAVRTLIKVYCAIIGVNMRLVWLNLLLSSFF